MTDIEKVQSITRHINLVQQNAQILAEKLIKLGENDLAIHLVKNSLHHDSSKFSGIEWKYLLSQPEDEEGKLLLKIAICQHNTTNKHHPEAWPGGIHSMDDLALCEFCCDTKSRASEFGTSFLEWINGPAMARYKFSKNDLVYEKIMKYVNLLIDQTFVAIKE